MKLNGLLLLLAFNLSGCVPGLAYTPGPVRATARSLRPVCAAARVTEAEAYEVYGPVQTGLLVTFAGFERGGGTPDSVVVLSASFSAPGLRFDPAEVRARTSTRANYSWVPVQPGLATALPRGDVLVVSRPVVKESIEDAGGRTRPPDLFGIPVGFDLGWSQRGTACSIHVDLSPKR